MKIEIPLRFSSPTAQRFFECSKRNQLWISGYGAGKTYTACQKIITLMVKFPGYRVAVGRHSATELKRTTMQTFYKVCPPELYSDKLGGKRIEGNPPYVQLINGSLVYWMHFDQFDEGSLRSLEVNAAVIDQAEEIPEKVYLTLDARVGRWDEVEIPKELLEQNPSWPRNALTGRPMAPAYMLLLANPPDEGEFSYLWQRFHPNSSHWQEDYKDTHAFFQSGSGENIALPPEVLKTMMTRDPEWVDRYVHGNFTKGEGGIHSISPLSYIEYDEEFFKEILRKGALTRVLDHGSTSPTCCLWWASWNGIHICYREYYQPNRTISSHRKAIHELSENEEYVLNLADPQIFKKESQKYGGFWSVSDEYADPALDSLPLYWAPADNNEFATRNRINEYLAIDSMVKHPITGIHGAPRIYFIKRSGKHPFGCNHVISETESQKKELLDEINGKKIYGDERDKSVADHAYDPLRYYISWHIGSKKALTPKPKPNSFFGIRNRMKALQRAGYV